MIASRPFAAGLLLPLVIGTAEAHGPRHSTARVVGVEPIYETVVVETPLTTCYSDFVERAVRQSGAVAVVSVPVERCTTEVRRHTESRITGYWVDYRDRGRYHRLWSPYDPGPGIRIATRS
jgi:uncharacterized protein YcfJ